MRPSLPLIIIAAALVLTAGPVNAANVLEPEDHLTWRFKGQPPMRIVFHGVESTIQFGRETLVALRDAASADTGIPGHFYEVDRDGKLFSYLVGSSFQRRDAAELHIWP